MRAYEQKLHIRLSSGISLQDKTNIATSISVEQFYKVTGLLDIEGYYKRQHAERMMLDRCHGKQLEFVFEFD